MRAGHDEPPDFAETGSARGMSRKTSGNVVSSSSDNLPGGGGGNSPLSSKEEIGMDVASGRRLPPPPLRRGGGNPLTDPRRESADPRLLDADVECTGERGGGEGGLQERGWGGGVTRDGARV